MAASTLCLNMIVKNEAHVIRRCLDSVLPFIDRWLIVDTGSSDGTQEIIREHLRGVPGELHERTWRNFGHNRSEALSLAAPLADYLFFIDADEQLTLPRSFERPALSADGYYLECHTSGMTLARCALVSTRLPWRWQGVVHAALGCDVPHELATLAGASIETARDGARSRDPDTYRKDAALLEKAIEADPSSARDVFYLAQSYRDCGELSKSRDAYLRRADMPGSEEETWYALYQAALLEERLGSPPGVVSFSYLSAYQARPTRAEPLVQLARYHRQRKQFNVALSYARRAVATPKPADMLFVDDATYRYRALDELAVAAFYTPFKEEGRAALLRLMAENQFPESERPRMLENCGFFGVQPESSVGQSMGVQPGLAANANR